MDRVSTGCVLHKGVTPGLGWVEPRGVEWVELATGEVHCRMFLPISVMYCATWLTAFCTSSKLGWMICSGGVGQLRGRRGRKDGRLTMLGRERTSSAEKQGRQWALSSDRSRAMELQETRCTAFTPALPPHHSSLAASPSSPGGDPLAQGVKRCSNSSNQSIKVTVLKVQEEIFALGFKLLQHI